MIELEQIYKGGDFEVERRMVIEDQQDDLAGLIGRFFDITLDEGKGERPRFEPGDTVTAPRFRELGDEGGRTRGVVNSVYPNRVQVLFRDPDSVQWFNMDEVEPA